MDHIVLLLVLDVGALHSTHLSFNACMGCHRMQSQHSPVSWTEARQSRVVRCESNWPWFSGKHTNSPSGHAGSVPKSP
ncbi:hypothetical protein IWX46DRAFT_595755 [Phyllosticta citricarpa]|uniref:Secreted protein n=1 Tax=Phyllosticta citricarpa TaxID=55181 RepID=A0ABR1MH62_9PEZI